MLETFGNGVTANCTWCSTVLSLSTLEADRIIPGGSYRRSNVIPACRECNVDRGTLHAEDYISICKNPKQAAHRLLGHDYTNCPSDDTSNYHDETQGVIITDGDYGRPAGIPCKCPCHPEQ